MAEFISYSANFEDLIFQRIFGSQAHGTFVDVGAEHPILGNDTYALYLRGWRGLNFEPNASYHELLIKERPDDNNLLLALSSSAAQSKTYFEVENTGLSTFEPEFAERHMAADHRLVKRELPTSTLAIELERANVTHIDILKVDVEGHEEQVLLGNDWVRFRPSLIVVEATLPQSPVRQVTKIREMLQGKGYRHAHFDGLNDFYLEQNFTVSSDAFLPPNVFDNVETMHARAVRDAFGELTSHAKRSEAHFHTATSQQDRKLKEQERNTQDALHHNEKQKAYIAQQDAQIRHLLARVQELETAAHQKPLKSVNKNATLESELFKIAVAATLVTRRQIFERGMLASKKQKPIDIVRRSFLFDANWYFERYPELKAANISAEEHYLQFGAREGRDPGPLFNTLFYIKHNPQVVKLNMNPLVHFELEGYKVLLG